MEEGVLNLLVGREPRGGMGGIHVSGRSGDFESTL